MGDVTSYTQTLAEFAATTTVAELPERTRRGTKRLILDTLGCAIGGRHIPSSRVVHEVKTASGGAQQSTILVTGERLPTETVAYVNAHCANALDAEETILHSGHLAACAVPPALAVAERERCSGEDLVAAVAVGFDVAARIGTSCRQLDVNDSGTVEIAPVGGLSWAAFASTIATGRIVGLTAEQMRNAFGITVATTPLPIGGRWGKIRSPRPMTKYAMYGAMAAAGITAAMLARAGFEGDCDILDDDRGFWRIMGSRRCEWNALTDGLGERFLGDVTSYKLFPACHWAMPALDMFARLCRDEGIVAADIERVEVLVPEGAVTKFMDEPDVATVVDGQFSIPHLIALAAVKGESNPDWHTPEALVDPAVRDVAARVHVGVHEAAKPAMQRKLLEQGHCEIIPTVVSVHTADRTVRAEADYAHGDGWAPGSVASDDELRAKFRRFCTPSLGRSQVDEAIEIIDDVESHGTVDSLVSSLVART